MNMVYCKYCEAILMDYQVKMVEYHLQQKQWTSIGNLTDGKETIIEGYKDETTSPYCSICNNETPYYVKLERDVLLLIIKFCFRKANGYRLHEYRFMDKGFKIELKHQEPDSLQMVPPTIQEIKEAMVEKLI